MIYFTQADMDEPNLTLGASQQEVKPSASSDPGSPLKSKKETVFLSWKAPVRPFKRRGKEFLTTVLMIAFLTGVIFYFIEGILPVIVIVALVFLVWVFSTFQPEEVEHKISNRGVVFAGKLYRWGDLIRFWFAKRLSNELFVVETVQMPGRLELVINPEDKATIRETVEEYVPYEEAPPNFLDKSASWLAKRVPLED